MLWDGPRSFATASEQQFAVALDILRDRAESGLGGSFAVLVRPDGPVPGPTDRRSPAYACCACSAASASAVSWTVPSGWCAGE